MEIVLAESSLVTEYYFIWSTSNVSIFLACLGLTVLPVNIVVGNYISNIFEERYRFKYYQQIVHGLMYILNGVCTTFVICYLKTTNLTSFYCFLTHLMIPFWLASACRQVLLTSEIMVCIGLLLSFHIMIPYSVTQYVGSALLTFVSAEVLEGNLFSLYIMSKIYLICCIR